jgi:MFS family permease
VKNWITELNLVCEDPRKIGGIGSSYFIGTVFSLILFVRLSDIYGRKPLVILTVISNVLSYAGILFYAKELYYLYAYYFMMGMGGIMITCVIYSYLVEFMPNNNKIFVTTLFLMMQAFPRILIPLYLWNLSNDPFKMELFGFTLMCLGSIIILFIPESPKFYFSKDRFMECERVLN